MPHRDGWETGGTHKSGSDDDEEWTPRHANLIFFTIHLLLSLVSWWWASQWAPMEAQLITHWTVVAVSAVALLLSGGLWAAAVSRRSFYAKNKDPQLDPETRRLFEMRAHWRSLYFARYALASFIWLAPWAVTTSLDQWIGAINATLDWATH